VEAQASFIPCISGVPHRADIAHKALIVTAGFPRYEALRGFRCVSQCVVCQINVLAGRRTHGPCVPTNVVFVLWRERRLRETATPWRGPTSLSAQSSDRQINVLAGRRTHGPCVPTNVVFVLWRERRLRETATPGRGPTSLSAVRGRSLWLAGRSLHLWGIKKAPGRVVGRFVVCLRSYSIVD
jgi:hypothetical protein